MTLHEIAHFFHHVGHKHTRAVKDGVGTVETCSWRLPMARVHVSFRPDIADAGWHYVPCSYDEDGVLLMTRIVQADDAYDAMRVLRAEYDVLGFAG